MRASVDLNSPDESSVRLVHYDISGLQLFQDILVQIAIVRVDHHQIVHLIQLVIILHFVEVVNDQVILLISSWVVGLYLGHERRNLGLSVFHDLDTAISRSTAISCCSRASSDAASFIWWWFTTIFGSCVLIGQRSIAIQGLLILIEQGGADFGKVLPPFQIIS